MAWPGSGCGSLVEVVFVVGGVAGHGLFEDLRLFAFVEDFGEQPEVVPLGARVVGDFQEVAAVKRGLVAPAFGLLVVGAVAFEGALAEELAARAVDEAAGVVVVFEVWLGTFAVGLVCRFELQAWFFEVVVAACGAAGAGFQAQLEAFDHRLIGNHATALHIRGRLAEFREHGLVVAEHQQMPFGRVLEVVVNAFFFTQALNKM